VTLIWVTPSGSPTFDIVYRGATAGREKMVLSVATYVSDHCGPTQAKAVVCQWEAAAKRNIAFFRAAGYTQPIEIMTNFQGRDLYAIHEYGDSIRSTDTVTVNGYPQTMFGWQAYWGTTDGYYPTYQGSLFYPGQNKKLSGADAIHLFATQEDFPIEIGIDNYGGDTNLDYKAEIDQSAIDDGTWLWWIYNNGNVDCPVSGNTCNTYVKGAPNGFGGAYPLTAS